MGLNVHLINEANCFAKLPEKILTEMLSHLDFSTLAKFSMVCKSMKKLCSDSILWEVLYSRQFTASYNLIRYLSRKQEAVPRNWRMEFIRKFTEKRCDVCGLAYNYFNDYNHSHSVTKKVEFTHDKPEDIIKKLRSKEMIHKHHSIPYTLKEDIQRSSSSDQQTPTGSISTYSGGSFDYNEYVQDAKEILGLEDYVYKRKSKYKTTETSARTKRNLFANVVDTSISKVSIEILSNE